MELKMIEVNVIKESCKYGEKFKVGDCISHPVLGDGVIIGFSEITGEPLGFFYDAFNKEKVSPIGFCGEELFSIN